MNNTIVHFEIPATYQSDDVGSGSAGISRNTSRAGLACSAVRWRGRESVETT
jgi:hypothetical protein